MSIGRRIAFWRKRVGIKSTRELAEKLGNGQLSESVLQNIESGRRADITTRQLMEIAWALGVSPLVLLLPQNRPMDFLDPGGESPVLAGVRVRDAMRNFMVWEAYNEDDNEAQANARFIARGTQQLYTCLRELQHREIVLSTDKPEQIGPDAREQLLNEGLNLVSQVDILKSRLAALGVDVSWVRSSWAHIG